LKNAQTDDHLMTDSKKPSTLKVAGINILILFVMTNVLYWGIPTVTAISDFVRSKFAASGGARTESWIAKHHRETQASKLLYKSYVGWRGKVSAGETVNVEGPYGQRKTVNTAASGGKTAYFFGGSTMWGVGAPDGETIPSQFAAITGIRSENFGERGWTSHQSLMQLIQLIQDGHRPDIVVFYDGANEVFFKCDLRHNAESHGWEGQISGVISEPVKSSSFTHYFAPIDALAGRIQRALSRALGAEQTNEYAADCDKKPAKAKAIAENLLRDWQIAKQLVASYGGEFIAVLQPVSFYSKGRLNNLALQSPYHVHLRAQYDTIYPVLIEAIARGGDQHNLVSVLDHDENFYIDYCHLTPNGNRLVAQRLAEIVAATKPK
jgi:lysophospholipase L1-like esterase